MPDRFKVTKTDVPEIDTTYNSIIKDDDESAVLGKLLPPTSTDDSCEKKGKLFIFYVHGFVNGFQ